MDCHCRPGTWRELCDADAGQETPGRCHQYAEHPGGGNNERPGAHALTVAEPHPLNAAGPHALKVAGPHALSVAGPHALTIAEWHAPILVGSSVTEG